MTFENGLQLDIFCNEVASELGNYSVGDQDNIYSVCYVERKVHVTWERTVYRLEKA